MSMRTAATEADRSFDSDCCSKMLRAFRIGSPLFTIVENCLENKARSFTLTRLNSVISRFTPARYGETLMGT